MVLALIGQKQEMLLSQCFPINAVSGSMKYVALCLMPTIGLDRLVAVLVPFRFFSKIILWHRMKYY
jgi:hypothetical protein